MVRLRGYIDQYFAKASYKFDVAGAPLSTSYQFYGTRDKVSNGGVNDIYDGTAWLQALTFGYKVADVPDLRLEGTWVKADGQQGYFLQRMTLRPTPLPMVVSISGGITAPTLTPMAKKRSSLARCMTQKTGICRAGRSARLMSHAWDAKPGRMSSPDAYYDPDYRLKESAYSLDAMYTVQEGRAKAPCSNCTLPNTTTIPIFRAGAAATATSSRMSAT